MWHFSFSEDQIDIEGKEKSHHQHSSRMDISYACRVLNRQLQEILPTRGAHIFQKSRSYLKILCTRKVTWSKFHSEGPTNIRCHHTKFSCLRDLSPRICALQLPTMVQSLGLLCKIHKRTTSEGTMELQVHAVIVERKYCPQSFWSHPK